MKKLKIAILGSGNIGTDLLVKILQSPYLECSLFIGKRLNSPGMSKAKELGVRVSDQKIAAIQSDPTICDLVFDATSAQDHLIHWPILRDFGKTTINLTPAKIGEMIVPAVEIKSLDATNYNLISCGGQASIPLAYALGKLHKEIEYIEVVSSIASKSAGPATRSNLDEYIENTEKGLRVFSKALKTKAILILNPAIPEIHMQTTLYAKIKNPKKDLIPVEIIKMVKKLQEYVPGYKLIVPPIVRNDLIIISIKVTGKGDYLPKHAGNLDIINCAAITIAESFAKKKEKAYVSTSN